MRTTSPVPTSPVDQVESEAEAVDDLIVQRPEGLYCPPGGFYIDPWRPVDRAVLTHAHADHARRGSAHYLAAAVSQDVLRARLGAAYRPAQQLHGAVVLFLRGVGTANAGAYHLPPPLALIDALDAMLPQASAAVGAA